MPEEEQEVPRKKKKRKTEEQDSAEVEGQNVPSLSNNGKVARRNSATSILKQVSDLKASHNPGLLLNLSSLT